MNKGIAATQSCTGEAYSTTCTWRLWRVWMGLELGSKCEAQRFPRERPFVGCVPFLDDSSELRRSFVQKTTCGFLDSRVRGVRWASRSGI